MHINDVGAGSWEEINEGAPGANYGWSFHEGFGGAPVYDDPLACISHRLTAEARDRPAITALRLLAVLNVLSEYASARQAARASY